MTTSTGPRIGSLFSGYGGLEQGVHAVLGGHTAWVSDIDPGACKILAHRYPGVPNLGDITLIDWAAAPPIEILCAGFPCQDVSGAGKQAGLRRGTRSGLWHEVVRAIDALQPGLVVLENVRGLLSARGDEPGEAHLRAEGTRDACKNLIDWIDVRRARAVREGRTEDARALAARRGRVVGLHKRAVARAKWHERRLVRAIGTVLRSLADLGYDAVWYGLRAADVGAAHGRFRVFILAWHATNARGEHSIERWLTGSCEAPSGQAFSEPAGRDRAPLMPTPRAGDGTKGGPNQRGSAGDLMLPSAVQLIPTPLSSDAGPSDMYGSGGGYGGYDNRTLTDATSRQPGRWGQYAEAIDVWERLTRPAPEPTELTSRGTARLAARFSEWLMGLDDGWVTDVPGITRNEALKACGNGVVPQQAEAAVRFLLPYVLAQVAA